MNNEENITYLTLDSGLRVVHIHIPDAAVGYFGVAVRAGSSDEQPGQYGLAHFVEHTIFKGTPHRSSWHILNRMEAVGGELNAFTTKEDTVVYTAFTNGNLARAVDLVADLVLNSVFPDSELNKERDVVADEIDSYLDQPSEAVFDDFEDLVFAGTPLGHNILGDKQSVASFGSADCRGWLERYYTADRMVAFYSGAVDVNTFTRLVTKHFAGIRRQSASVESKTASHPDAFQHTKAVEGCHQSHTVMGCVLPAMDLHSRAVLSLLCNILGGPGMNARLNVELRERRGLVYTVEASANFFSDRTLTTVYWGCDPDDTQSCTRLVRNQIRAIAQRPLTDRQLQAAQKQYLGQMALSAENRAERAIAVGRATLMHGRAETRARIEQAINAVTPQEIQDMAARLSDLSSLTFFPAHCQ